MSRPTPPSPKAIRSLRLARGESQPDFGAAVGLEGAPEARRVTISRWEGGHQAPDAWHSGRLREMMAEAEATR